MVRALLILSLLILPVYDSVAGDRAHHAGGDAKFTQHFQDSLFKITEKRLFSVEIVLKGKKPTVGKNSLDIVIHDNEDRDVVKAILEVTPWMAGHGGADTRPRVTEKGGGLYRVEDVDFPTAGAWQLRVKVRKDDREDFAVFDLPNVNGKEPAPQSGSPAARHQTHGAAAAVGPAVLDTAASLFTKEKLFRVSYETEGGSVPMNRIHSWRLKITTPDGSPVQNAGVTVEGGMPEHGHGLPTKPQVAPAPDREYYLAEGMKFTMPGWWTVTFTVSAGGKSDSVTFNLHLK